MDKNYRMNSIKESMVKLLFTIGFFILFLSPFLELMWWQKKIITSNKEMFNKIIYLLIFFTICFLIAFLLIKFLIRRSILKDDNQIKKKYYVVYLVLYFTGSITLLIFIFLELFLDLKLLYFILLYIFGFAQVFACSVCEFLDKLNVSKIKVTTVDKQTQIKNVKLDKDEEETIIKKE